MLLSSPFSYVALRGRDEQRLLPALGMAEMGMIPTIFAHRLRHGTPTYSILCSVVGVVVLSFMSFQAIIAFLNFLYGLGMLAVFVKLRVKDPDLPKPYRIPVSKVE